jgi:plastocyanin
MPSNRPARLGSFAALVLVAALVLAGCGGGGDDKTADTSSTTASTTTSTTEGSTTTAAPDAASGDAVSIKDFTFNPKDLRVAAGTKVTWTNDDTTTHTATGDDDEFDTGDLAPGDSGDFTFEQAGTFTYHCNIHPTMKATITVK